MSLSLKTDVRVGLATYGNIPTGLGQLARRFSLRLPFTSRLVYPHPKLDRLNDKVGIPIPQEVHSFLQMVDVVLVLERPMPDGILATAKSMGKRTVCVVMPEWLSPTLAWLDDVDTFICFTRQGYTHVRERVIQDLSRVVYCDCPLDPTELDYRVRERVDRIVYCDGWGGVYARKGYPEVQELLRLQPKCVEVKSQRIPVLSVDTPNDLYTNADAILVPGRFDGLGLTTLEAMASGCIVLATDADPYRQFIYGAYGQEKGKELLLPVRSKEIVRILGQEWVSCRTDPHKMLERIDLLKKRTDVGELSMRGRAYIERLHGADVTWSTFWDVIQRGA